MRAVLLLFLLLIVPARAGDMSSFDPVGFSADGTRYAFIEYGVSDGSGAPYATGYLIDTVNDRWVSGTPVRLGGGEPGDLSATEIARRIADLRAEARTRLSQAAGVETWAPGHIHVLSPATDVSRDGSELSVGPYYSLFGRDQPVTVRLEQLPLEQTSRDCPFGDTKGMRVTLEEGGRTSVLQEDTRIPKSRYCPTQYRLAGVQTHYVRGDGPVSRVLVVLVQMFTPGFEGSDVRWLALTKVSER